MTAEEYAKSVTNNETYQAELIKAFKAGRDTSAVSRVEVTDEKGRSYVKYCKEGDVTLNFQDSDKTLKVFINQLF